MAAQCGGDILGGYQLVLHLLPWQRLLGARLSVGPAPSGPRQRWDQSRCGRWSVGGQRLATTLTTKALTAGFGSSMEWQQGDDAELAALANVDGAITVDALVPQLLPLFRGPEFVG